MCMFRTHRNPLRQSVGMMLVNPLFEGRQACFRYFVPDPPFTAGMDGIFPPVIHMQRTVDLGAGG